MNSYYNISTIMQINDESLALSKDSIQTVQFRTFP